MKRIFLLFILATFLYSCDVVSPTNNYYIADTIVNNPDDGGDEETVVKKVLLLDFTGTLCLNCPAAHEIVHQLQDVYPNKIVPVAIYVPGLSVPVGGDTVDLRTPDGTAICTELDPPTLPKGLIDKYGKNNWEETTSWADVISNAVNEVPQIGIKINNSFDDATKKLDINIDLVSQIKTDKALKLVVFITEDHIITRQAISEPPGYIQKYEQMHVFRDAVTDVWGDPIFADGVEVNKTDKVTLSCTFEGHWNADNANVVAFIVDEESSVLNAQEKTVK